jgi:hypothetical protein
MNDQEDELTTADLAGADPVRSRAVLDEPRRDAEAAGPLLPADEAGHFDDQWRSVQASFVDRPHEAVEQADRLVAELMQRLATEFNETRADLERQWERSDDVSTEDLRVAMTRYRSFFDRLLAA